MTASSKLGLYFPIGTFLAAHELVGSTTTQFHCSNAAAAGINIGMRVRIYAHDFITDPPLTLIATAVITNKEANTPSAGITRLTFTPAASQAPDFADDMYDPEVINVTTAISNQMQTLDDKMDAILCTAGTRPSSPFVGQITVESSVFGAPPFEVRRWNGSTWEQIVPPGSGGGGEVGGRVGYTNTDSVSSTSTTNTEVGPYLSLTFTAQQNHSYLIEFSGALDCNNVAPSPGAYLKYRVANGGSVTTSDTYIDSGIMTCEILTGLPMCQTFNAVYTHSGATGQVTIGVFHETFTSSRSTFFAANSHSYLAIEDGGII